MMTVLRQRNIIKVDNDLGIFYIKLFGHNYLVELTPEGHSPANIIGLKTLCRLGLQLAADPDYSYHFILPFDYFDI